MDIKVGTTRAKNEVSTKSSNPSHLEIYAKCMAIDKMAVVVFAIAFAVFNMIYWGFYINKRTKELSISL